MDRRWQQLGDVLVNYSARVRPGERVMIAMQEVGTLPLVRAVYEAAVRAGAYVQVQFASDHLRHALMRWGTKEQVAWVPEVETYGMEWADVYFGLRGAHNPHEFAGIAPETLALHQRAMGSVSALRWQKTRWCLVRVPAEAMAWQAQTDLDSLLDQFFAACLLDWEAESAAWHEVGVRLQAGSMVRLVARGTDLAFSTLGRRWVLADGRLNMPDGEIMTAPVVASVEGHISFEQPAVFAGRHFDAVRLAWRQGRLVDASAASNEETLRRVLGTDAGASLVGEFAIGLNQGLTRFCHDPLIDEKIAGTVHIALGRAYPECGGDNASVIHWDIVKDLRDGGSIILDGIPVYEQGHFLPPTPSTLA